MYVVTFTYSGYPLLYLGTDAPTSCRTFAAVYGTREAAQEAAEAWMREQSQPNLADGICVVEA